MNQQLKDNNYLYIPGFLSKGKAARLAKSFEEYALKNNLPGDEQAPRSSSCYNYVEFTELLCNKLPRVASFLGEDVFPTYTYGRVYRKGDDLKVHKDRDACEISLTVNLYQEHFWPIYIRRPDGTEARVLLHPGDAMMYLGCEAEHWRDELQDDKHIQVFLHYVRSRGPRAKCLFDSRAGSNTPTLHHAETKYPANLMEYIMCIEDLVPGDLIDELLAEYKDTDEWGQAKVGGGGGVIDTSIRGATTINISIDESKNKNPEKRQSLDARIFECVASAIQQYSAKHPDCQIVKDSGYELLRYTEGMGYTQHVDNFLEFPRAVSCSIALNDDYEGGEFTFFDQRLLYKQKKGSALLFPSSFQYPHQVNKVKKGTRYSLITWFS
jgi:hypothetical protein